MIIENLYYAVKAVRGKLTAKQDYCKIQEKHQINNLTSYLKQLEKRKTIKSPSKLAKVKKKNHKDQSKNMKINKVDYSKSHRKKQENFRQTCTPKPLTV